MISLRHLSDVNKDNALDIEEFCIAMHMVVAVKHDVELPSVLPAMLAPKAPAEGFTASFPVTSNGHPEEERPHSPKDSGLPPDEQVCRSKAIQFFYSCFYFCSLAHDLY